MPQIPPVQAGQVATSVKDWTEFLWGVGGPNVFDLKNRGGAKLKATNEIDDIIAPMLDPQILMVWRAATRAGQEAKLDIGEEARERQARNMTPQQRAAQRHRENWAKRLRGCSRAILCSRWCCYRYGSCYVNTRRICNECRSRKEKRFGLHESLEHW